MTHEKKTIKSCSKVQIFVSVLGYLLLFVNVILVFVPDLEEKDQRKTNNVLDNIGYNDSSQHFDEQGDGTSACLLIMDANHLLIEWIAYHYHVLRLRHLIVAVDPRSKTTPTDVLKRWAGRMNIQIWHDEKRYINLQIFRQNVEERMEEYHREASNFDLSAHRIRQREFNKECIIAHKMNERGWTFLTDTDEFIYMNPSKRDQRNFPDWNISPSVDEPDSVYTVLQKLRFPNNPFGVTEPCLRIARRQFSANEDQPNLLPSHLGLNLKNFQTIRWRKWGFRDPRHPRLAGKIIIDLRRLKLVDIIAEENYGDPHVPLPSICLKEDVFATEDEVILLANHYMGTAEQWNFRSNDARGSECMRLFYDHHNAIVGKYESSAVRSWLEGFISSIGMGEAVLLLEGVGIVESVPNLEKFKQFNNDDESGEAGEQEYNEPFKIGERILYVYEDKWYIGTILASNCRGGYDVRYDDASWEYNLCVEEMILLSLETTNL